MRRAVIRRQSKERPKKQSIRAGIPRLLPGKKLHEFPFHKEPVPPDADVVIRFLGTAGFVFESKDHTIVVDPYVSRPTLLQHLFKLRPNENLVRSIFPRADEVLVGHSHSDHILDAPLVCKLTNAKFVGSESACIVAYGAGVPFDKIVNVAPKGEPVRKDPITTKSGWIKAVPSLHGNYTPLPGDIPGSFPKPGTDPLPEPEFQFPCRVQKLRCGEVLDWYLEMNGCRIVHIDSANICEDELAGCSADVLCLCAAGWTKDYVQRALDLVQPKVVIPCHWDYFLRPFHKVPKEMRGSNLEKLLPEIEKRGVKPAVLPFGGSLGFSKAS